VIAAVARSNAARLIVQKRFDIGKSLGVVLGISRTAYCQRIAVKSFGDE
jgi:hypothetical protein